MDYQKIRRQTRETRIGSVAIGGRNPIAIQSMTNTDTHDAEATISQILSLASAGCDIVRITVPDLAAAETVRVIKERGIGVPIVADIHFDYRIALKCAEYGIDKIRINPGNIGDEENIKAVCDACRVRNSYEIHQCQLHGPRILQDVILGDTHCTVGTFRAL